EVTDMDERPALEGSLCLLTHDRGAAAADGIDSGGSAPSMYWYPPIGPSWGGYYGGRYGYTPAPYIRQTEQNIPEGTVALKEGAEVISADDERVGTVEQVLTNADLNRATHLLITEGWLFPEKRTIPVDWIREAAEDTVWLAVTARELERVPAYQP